MTEMVNPGNDLGLSEDIRMEMFGSYRVPDKIKREIRYKALLRIAGYRNETLDDGGAISTEREVIEKKV
jgi:hypothetical protein